MLFASYVEQLVSSGKQGYYARRGRNRVPMLRPHEALDLLQDNKFTWSSTSYNALISAIKDFVASLPDSTGLLVPRSQTVREAYLELLNAHFSWFTLKERCCVKLALLAVVSHGARALMVSCIDMGAS